MNTSISSALKKLSQQASAQMAKPAPKTARKPFKDRVMEHPDGFVLENYRTIGQAEDWMMRLLNYNLHKHAKDPAWLATDPHMERCLAALKLLREIREIYMEGVDVEAELNK